MIFKELKIKSIKLKNRIVVSPMCQYSARNGCPSDWHFTHLGKLIETGAGMVMIESTAVNNVGKITHSDLCLKNKIQEKKFKELKNYLNKINKTPIGIQISHSGRKGSSYVPWVKSNASLKNQDKSWQTVAPSSIKRTKGWQKPKSLSKKEIYNLIKDFKNTTIRAKRVGFECLELHMAHGYLLHQFLSPISNLRRDEVGNSLANRLSFPLNLAKEIRKIWPKNKILGARITATDHLSGGITLKDSITLIKELKKIGFDYVCVSSGGILPKTNLKFKKAFRTKLSKKIKKETSIITRVTGLITNLKEANKIISENSADLIAIGRTFINDPMWIYKAAKVSKKNKIIPPQYLRGI
jgi:2,4-dienoyl-CoA reductase-like NADH-dependent reductase (Old Yellow Enzyme family)